MVTARLLRALPLSVMAAPLNVFALPLLRLIPVAPLSVISPVVERSAKILTAPAVLIKVSAGLVLPVKAMLLLTLKVPRAVSVRSAVPVAAPRSAMAPPVIVRAAAPKAMEPPVRSMPPPDAAVLATVMLPAIVSAPLAVTVRLATTPLGEKVPRPLKRPISMPLVADVRVIAPPLSSMTLSTLSAPRAPNLDRPTRQ